MTATHSDIREPLPPMPDFASFYRAVNGREPFPWQSRLATRVATSGWPKQIGIPTGMGKTACLEVALWWLASEAHLPGNERRAPTRIWWVVNRRLLVDATFDHAKRLSRLLSSKDLSGGRDVLDRVAARLKALSVSQSSPPLDVIRLRGGVSSATPIDPSVPTIMLCTLPMYGSRLLFRGYGSRFWSIDAAMAGTDSMVLLDEAHLAPHLEKLLGDLQECHPKLHDVLPGSRAWPLLVHLTATGNRPENADDRFDLNDDDISNPEIAKRLNASKPMRVVIVAGKKGKDGEDGEDGKDSEDGKDKEGKDKEGNPPDSSNGEAVGKDVFERRESIAPSSAMMEAVEDILHNAPAPTSILVFANTPTTARAIFDKITKNKSLKAVSDALLLTGRVREREAEIVRKKIMDPKFGMPAIATPSESGRERHLIVVATQTLEVGADLDAEHLVTEQCGVRALTQRLGRLNRLGRHEHASAAYFHFEGNSKENSWPVYGGEPAEVLERLKAAKCVAEGDAPLNMSVARLSGILGEPQEVSESDAPEILPEILREWVKTSLPDKDEAPVEPYFAGFTASDYRISVVWRIHVPKEDKVIWPRVTDDEAIDVPIGEFRDSFGKAPPETVTRLLFDRVGLEKVPLERLRPGDTVVLPAGSAGKMDEFGWNASAKTPVVDVSLMRRGLPLDAEALDQLFLQRDKEGNDESDSAGAVKELKKLIKAIPDPDNDSRDPDEPVPDMKDLAQRMLALVRELPVPPSWDANEWQSFVDSLQPFIVSVDGEVSRLRVEKPRDELRADGLDEMSIIEKRGEAKPGLKAHGAEVGERAYDIARQVGFPDELANVVRLAARLHDIGKADNRFQRWLDPKGEAEELLAKSDSPRSRWASLRVQSGWPKGGRHEALSARLVTEWLRKNPDKLENHLLRGLLVHLVISHHGRGRPLVLPVADQTDLSVTADIKGERVTVVSSLAEIDWDQPTRFRQLNDHFGPWGLSLLEAALIRADHAISGGDSIAEVITEDNEHE